MIPASGVAAERSLTRATTDRSGSRARGDSRLSGLAALLDEHRRRRFEIAAHRLHEVRGVGTIDDAMVE